MKSFNDYQHDVWDGDDDETAGEVSAQVGAHPPRSVHLRAQPITAQVIIRCSGGPITAQTLFLKREPDHCSDNGYRLNKRGHILSYFWR